MLLILWFTSQNKLVSLVLVLSLFYKWFLARLSNLPKFKYLFIVKPKYEPCVFFWGVLEPKALRSHVILIDYTVTVLWPPDAKSQLIGKDPDAGKDWGHEEKGATEYEMVKKHHRLNGHEFEQALGIVKDKETWCAAVHGVAKSWTWLRDWTTTVL